VTAAETAATKTAAAVTATTAATCPRWLSKANKSDSYEAE
jgi:hypothetical protein